MLLNIRFDTKKNVEVINENLFLLGTNFIDFISLNIENILNDEIISSLSEKNYKEIITKITTASDGIIIPEIIDINVLINLSSKDINIQQIKKDLTAILNTYNNFKILIEFCYFNDNLKNMTPIQRYIYYLHSSKTEEVLLPKQTISSFRLKTNKQYSKHLKNDDMLIMLQENSPFLYYSYKCSNISDYMIITFLKLIENNYLILKCKNCGKYFIAYKRTDTLYCDRQSPADATKTCKQYGAKKAWKEKIKDENDWRCLYRRVYQSFQVKAKRNPNNLQFKQNFDNFRTDANKWKKAIKEGTKTEADFMYWLQDFRKKK